MNEKEKLPVIIGAGLSGMAISDNLSQAGIPHILLGAPPTNVPRLGESIDPAGTLALLKFYPEFDKYYFKKRWITVFLGEYATSCNFGQTVSRQMGLKMIGFDSPAEFIHVDRIGFDHDLYKKVVADNCCIHKNVLVESLDYDAGTDTFTALHLADGETLEPSFVFDCTNHIRLLGRTIDLPIEYISEPQRVVYTHFHAPEGTTEEELFGEEWEHATNILRLYEDWDAVDGLAWAIPLGSYISVGVSIPLEEGVDLDKDEVMDWVAAAYARRGLDFTAVFSQRREVVMLPRQQYFYYDRAYGRNWLLAGPSYGQVWFPSASGVGAAMVCGYLAPQFLQDPATAGQAYEAYANGFKESHRIFDWMIKQDHEMMTQELVKVESNKIVAENVKRVARLATIQNGKMSASLANLLIKAVSRDGVATSGCEVYQAELSEQTHTIFEQM